MRIQNETILEELDVGYSESPLGEYIPPLILFGTFGNFYPLCGVGSCKYLDIQDVSQ